MEAPNSLANISRKLVSEHYTTHYGGNVSVREASNMWITPSGVRKDELHPKICLLVDIDSGQSARQVGYLSASIEAEMHRLIYKSTDSQAVIHAHSPNALIFGFDPFKIPTINHEASLLQDMVGVVPYYEEGGDELAEAVGEIAKSCNIVVLQNHGLVAHGSNLNEAYALIALFEHILGIIFHARAAGINPTEIEEHSRD